MIDTNCISTQDAMDLDDQELPQFILSESLSWEEPETIDGINESDILNSSSNTSSFRERLEAGIADIKKSQGDSHPDVAFFVSKIGDACAQNHDFEDALRFYTEALDLKRRIFGQYHLEVADTLRSIGLVTKELHRFEQSLKSFSEAQIVYHKNIDSDDTAGKSKKLNCDSCFTIASKVACTHNDIGNIHFNQHRNDDAKDNYHKSLRIYQCLSDKAKQIEGVSSNAKSCTKIQGQPIDLMIAESLNNLASVCAESNDRTRAISYYNEALNIQMRELGEDDQAVAATLNNIGTMNFKAGNFDAALKSYKQALKMQRNTLGPSHIDTVDSILNIAATHAKAGDRPKSYAYLKRACVVATNALGEKHIKVGKIYSKLGRTSLLMGNEDQALRQYDLALSIFRLAGLQNDHRLVKSSTYSIALLKYRNQNDFTFFIYAIREMFEKIIREGANAFFMNESDVDTFLNQIGKQTMGVAGTDKGSVLICGH